MSLASHRLDLLRQAAFRRAVLRVGAQHGNVKAPLRYPAGFLVLATSYSRTAYRRTTIGAAAFHCRVRNGNGWGHCATVTRGPSRTGTWNRTSGFTAVAATQAPTRVSADAVALLTNSGS